MSEVIKGLLDEIKGMNQAQIDEKMADLKTAIEKRDKELDEKLGTMADAKEKALAEMEIKFQTKMAETVEKIGSAFPDVKPEENERFKDFGEYMNMVKKQDERIKDLAENTGNLGGYTVPTQFSNNIMKISLESSIVEQRATVLTLNAPTFEMPSIDPSSNADGSQYGGATAYWTDELQALTESNPTFDNIKLEVNKLTAFIEDSNELEQDSVANMGQLLTQMYGEVISFKKDSAFISGDGVKKPLGILNAPALVTVSRATASQVHPADIVGMMARFRGSYDKAVLLINQSTIPQVFLMKDDNGNYIWHPGMSGTIANKVLGTIYGIPYIITEKASALGTEGDIILADWSHYLVANRGGLVTDYSDHYFFNKDSRAYRCKVRVDGQPWLRQAITPYKGGSTLSPFVALS